jgi:hypothetical protein
MAASARHMIGMMTRKTLVIVMVVALTSPAGAQYDRDGRYVPSPNGIPADGNRASVPMYPGTPGGAIGTPNLPRNAYPVSPRSPMTPRLETSPTVYWNALPRALKIEQCEEGWVKSTGMSRVEFRRVCAGLKRRQERERG